MFKIPGQGTSKNGSSGRWNLRKTISMKFFLHTTLPALIIVTLLGCDSWFLDGRKITGPYLLIAIDIREQMHIAYDLGDGTAIGRIDPVVYAVGWNEKYIFAKQHPQNNRSITNYYIIDMTKDEKYADPEKSVIGPLTKQDYLRYCKEIEISNPLNFAFVHKDLE